MRQGRKASDLRRKGPSRPPYERILIVCEGKKTEPNYFEDIRQEYRLASAYIRIHHSDYGTQPRQIVDYAEHLFLQKREFERIYAVFDKDSHTTYTDAIARAEQLNGKLRNDEKYPVKFEAIASVPCFELWLLLHYDNIQAYFHRDEILKKLKKHIPNYEKGAKGIYALTKPNLSTALDRAKRLTSRFSKLPGTEAYTDVHALVATLQTLLKNKIVK